MNEQDLRKEQVSDLARLLDTDFGRRFLRRMLDELGLFQSVAAKNVLALEEAHAIWYRAGRQDFSHYLLSEASDANASGVQMMNAEADARRLAERSLKERGDE